MASKVVDKFKWKKERLAYPFITVTPAGDICKSNNWFKDIPIKIGNRRLFANLIIIKMDDYDVILGIN